MHFICIYYSFSKASGVYVGVCPVHNHRVYRFLQAYNYLMKKSMKFNADKCFTIRITNSRHPIRVDYKIHDQQLNLVPDSKYLGVSLDQTLSWKTHINNVTAKAYRTLGFLRRNMQAALK